MHGVTEMAPGKAASTGFLIGAGNAKNVAMAIGASVVIGQAKLPGVQIAVAVLVYAVLASLGVAAPLVVALVTGERSTAILTEARDWLERNNPIVLGIMYLVFAVVLVTRGIQALP
jgi:thiol:disulfide interchange protein